MKLSAAIKEKIKDCLKSIAPEARTYLYGSQARGETMKISCIVILNYSKN